MKNKIATFVLGLAAVAAPALAQNAPPMPIPAPLEKELAARASNVTEVTLGKNMLDFAAKFMDGKKGDDAAAKQLIQGLDGIYVRSYEFDKDGQVSADEIEQMRKHFETSEWVPIVRVRERKGAESTDILVKTVNGESRGMFILTYEPKELTVVLILGPIRMEDLGKLHGIGGLGGLAALGGEHHESHGKDKEKKGGNQ